MTFAPCLEELRTAWFPNITDAGLNRIIELLHKSSPLLIHGCFTRALPQGCIASHIAWHHPLTADLNHDAGIRWLCRIAQLNPATSKVLHMWDTLGPLDWEFRAFLLSAFEDEREVRQSGDRQIDCASLCEVG